MPVWRYMLLLPHHACSGLTGQHSVFLDSLAECQRDSTILRGHMYSYTFLTCYLLSAQAGQGRAEA
jgi:hypothetical protein